MKQQRQRDRWKRRRDDRTVVTSVMHDWFGGSSKMREDNRRPARLRGQLGLKGNEHLKLIGASGTPLGSWVCVRVCFYDVLVTTSCLFGRTQ